MMAFLTVDEVCENSHSFEINYLVYFRLSFHPRMTYHVVK